jgi:hypothetical protein
VCEAFLGIAPNKDLFWKVFVVKTHKAHGSDGSVLALMGGMNLQTRQGVSHSYPCLPLKTSNSGWHNHWFYIRDDAAAPSPFLWRSSGKVGLVELRVRQEAVVEGGGDPGDSCRPSIGCVGWCGGPVDHD